jgi:hypothetical protein
MKLNAIAYIPESFCAFGNQLIVPEKPIMFRSNAQTVKSHMVAEQLLADICVDCHCHTTDPLLLDQVLLVDHAEIHQDEIRQNVKYRD